MTPMQSIFSVRDTVAEFFMPPFFARTKGEALRSFSQAVNDEKHQIAMHPEQYELHYMGMFNDQTGEISPVEPESIGSGADFIQQK